jgi:hypothetical protein
MKIYQIHYSASEHIHKLRLAAGTPQSWGITDISRTYHLRSSVLFLIFSFLGWKYIRYIIQHPNIFTSWDWQLELLNLDGLQIFLARIILGAQFFFILSFLGWKYIRYIIQHPNIFTNWDWQLGLLNLDGLQTFLARIILGAQFFF